MKMKSPIFFSPNIDPLNWVPITRIPNLRQYYYVNRYSQIYSALSNKILAPSYNHAGYIVVSLNCMDGRRIQRKVHRISMMEYCYIEGCEFLEVNHKDGDKENNDISNLEWCTPKENTLHAIENNLRKSWNGSKNPKCKLSESDVKLIYYLYHIEGFEISDLLIEFPLANREMIRNILTGKTWSNVINNYCMCPSTIES